MIEFNITILFQVEGISNKMDWPGRIVAYLGYFLARFYLFPVYFLSGFVKRRPDLWVFGSWGGKRFADNAAAFFEYCHPMLGDRVRLVWISRDLSLTRSLRERGYEAYWWWSPRGIAACLRAKFYFFDSFAKDINFWLSRGAVMINLWSGIPLKTVERDIDNPDSRYFRLFHGSLVERILFGMMMPWHVARPHLLIATSEETAQITRRAFDVPEDSVVVTGFPRNDVLFGKETAGGEEQGAKPPAFRAAFDADRFIFMYLPTYRDSGKPFLNIDWAELDRLMERLGASFFFKFHPDDKGGDVGSLQNVVELPQQADIYDMLADTDALISDYSSIIFDFMLLNRPIVYYVPDLDEFVTSSRSLYFEPEEIAVGPMCSTPQDLMAALADVVEARDMPEGIRDRWDQSRRRFNQHFDGASCQRTLSVIEDRFFSGDVRANLGAAGRTTAQD